MSATDVIRRGSAAFNSHDAAQFAALYAPTALAHDPMYPAPLEGRAAIQEDMRSFFNAFPDITVTIHDVVDGGDISAYRATMKGTHRGIIPFEGREIPPTGRSVSFDGVVLSRFDGQGRILEEYRHYDFAGLLSQLDVTGSAS